MIKVKKIIGMTKMNKPRWLPYEDSLNKMTMKKGIFNIQPVDCPAMIECKTKNITNGNRLNYRTKSFIKINPSLLIISLAN